ncbi:unnamed protein product [Spirodela intermedia]|uniref:Uncharacterized protein n=1 Tax=Spirodela intermedia TaxID=51605 RepID=A0A7I8L2B8_SPIIN|nr:unnamed protein product [Spirodela intermedia]
MGHPLYARGILIFHQFSPFVGRFQHPYELKESFFIMWTQDQPLVNSRDKISSLCGFKSRTFHPNTFLVDARL